MNEFKQTLQEFDAEIVEMPACHRADFDKAVAEIRATLQRFPGIGLMAVAYVSTDECAKREGQQS